MKEVTISQARLIEQQYDFNYYLVIKPDGKRPGYKVEPGVSGWGACEWGLDGWGVD